MSSLWSIPVVWLQTPVNIKPSQLILWPSAVNLKRHTSSQPEIAKTSNLGRDCSVLCKLVLALFPWGTSTTKRRPCWRVCSAQAVRALPRSSRCKRLMSFAAKWVKARTKAFAQTFVFATTEDTDPSSEVKACCTNLLHIRIEWQLVFATFRA